MTVGLGPCQGRFDILHSSRLPREMFCIMSLKNMKHIHHVCGMHLELAFLFYVSFAENKLEMYA